MPSIFNEEGKVDIDQVWERIKKSVREGATMSMEKIEEYTKIGKLKIEEIAAKKKVERNFADIGERSFELIDAGNGNDVSNDLAVKKSIENIRSLRQELIDIDKKIKAASQEAKDKRRKDDVDEVTGI
jgi:hypothetical protein